MSEAASLARIAGALRQPLRRFVDESRARTAVLATRSGQVLAQHGLSRPRNVAEVAVLAAAVHASSRALEGVTGACPWRRIHQAGHRRQILLAPLRLRDDELVLVVIFGEDSSLGLVGLCLEELEQTIDRLPELVGSGGAHRAIADEDVEVGLRRLFPADSAEHA